MPLQNVTQAAASRLSFLYNIKIWVRLVATIAAMLCLAWGIMIFWTAQQQRDFALHQAHDLAMSVHQMTMANLLFMKVTKTIKKRHVYYSQVRQSAAVKDLRILRGPVVVHEMGDGDEIAMNPTEIEKKVIESGRTVFEEIEDPQHGHVLLAIFPATAAKNYLGRDCMECHEEAKEGQILGAVSMKISLVDLDQAVADSRLGMITATVMITVPLLAFIFIFVRSFVTNPLAAMGGNLQGIAGGAGDLTSRLPVRGRDEIGEVSAAFNAMMAKLQKLIIRINETSHHVSAAAREQSAQSEKIAAGSDKQTRKSAQAAQSLDEIAASIASVTEACGRVQALSQESRERTTAGMASLDDFSQKIRQVETAVSQIAATVEQFVTNTESIIKMTQEVKDIAGMTNLLALNAAIEAARAGEQGRGFAVVADEVRKLAEKSTRSATEIDAITRALAGESAEVRVAIRDGLEILSGSHASMANVANVLQEASGVVNRVAEGMNDILAATREQAVASSEISEQVEAISGQASENGQAIAAMKVSSQQLSSLAQSLEEELGRFKT